MDTTTLLSSARGSPISKADLKLPSLLISSSSHPPSPECLSAHFFCGSDDRIPRPVLGPRASQEVETGCRERRWALFFGDRLIQKGLQTCLGLPLSMYLGKSLWYLVVVYGRAHAWTQLGGGNWTHRHIWSTEYLK